MRSFIVVLAVSRGTFDNTVIGNSSVAFFTSIALLPVIGARALQTLTVPTEPLDVNTRLTFADSFTVSAATVGAAVMGGCAGF